MGVLSRCDIDKVYLISTLHNALWNCYFLSQLLFQSFYFLKVPTENSFIGATFSKNAVFQNSLFPTGNLVELFDLIVPGRLTK